MKEKIVLMGGGGHAKVMIDAIKKSKKFTIYGLVDPNIDKSTLVSGARVIGNDDILPKIREAGVTNAFIAIGSVNVDGCRKRKEIYEKIKNLFRFPVIVHPSAVIASDVLIGEGTFVAAGVVINPGTKIGRNAIINTNSSIDHDCVIGDFVHIAPGVTLSGEVKVGQKTHIGTGANVINNIAIGKRCMVAAGTTVRRNMADSTKNYGVHHETK